MTAAELKLWRALQSTQLCGASFRKQHPVGPYVLDFYCSTLRLAIEVDGGQHNEAAGMEKDIRRTQWLHRHGIVVLRFWNNDVLNNLEGVLHELSRTIGDLRRTPTLILPLSGGGKLGDCP